MAVVAAMALLASCGRNANNTRSLTLGGECFAVPAADLAYYDPKSRRSATLMFGHEQVRRAVPDYVIPRTVAGLERGALYVSVVLLTAPESERMRVNEKKSREDIFYDLWYGLDEFAGRTVTPIVGSSLLRVMPLADGPTWMVVTRRPDSASRDAHLQPDFWIGSCSAIDEGRLNSCQCNIEMAGLRMTMHTIEANLKLREPLARFVLGAMKPWRVACTAGRP